MTEKTHAKSAVQISDYKNVIPRVFRPSTAQTELDR